MNFPVFAMQRAASHSLRDARPDVLRLEGITLRFGGITALDDVGFSLHAGEIRSVIGPNGAGKSSLVNIISGLYRPSAGTVTIDDETHSRIDAARLADYGLARTFQNLALFPGLTVAQNIASGLAHTRRAGLVAQIAGLRSSRDDDSRIASAVREVAGLLDLHPILDRKVDGLSYGTRKQIELARALVASPRILLLDEPMAGLTLAEKSRMTRQIREARDLTGTSVILIEHDISVVMDLSDSIAVLDHGRLIADGTPAAVRNDPGVIRAYLGQEAA